MGKSSLAFNLYIYNAKLLKIVLIRNRWNVKVIDIFVNSKFSSVVIGMGNYE